MSQSVDRLLQERRRTTRSRRTPGAVLSLLLHGGAIGLAVLGPSLFASEPEPLQYVPVLLVPPQILGVEESPPPRPDPPRETPPPQPEPQRPEPSEEALPLPTDEQTEPETTPEPEPAPPPPDPDPPPPSVDDPPPTTRPGSPTGSPVGIANTDSVVGIEDPNFTYGYYVDRMVSIIRSQWQRPPLGSGVEGIVHFRIRKDGSIQDVQVVVSSGYNSFDLAALRAVQSARLPPLPRSYRENSLGVNLIFR